MCSRVRRRSVRRVPLWLCALLRLSFTPAMRSGTGSVCLRRKRRGRRTHPARTWCGRSCCSALPRVFPLEFAVHLTCFAAGEAGDACTHAYASARVAPRAAIEALQVAPPCLFVHAPDSLPGSALRKCVLYVHSRTHTSKHSHNTHSPTRTLPQTHAQVRRLGMRLRRCVRDSRGRNGL